MNNQKKSAPPASAPFSGADITLQEGRQQLLLNCDPDVMMGFGHRLHENAAGF